MSFNFTEADDSSDYEYPVHPLEDLIVPVTICSLVILVFGLIGNIIVISIIVILKEYRKSVTHCYMLQLAIADFLFLLTIPINVTEIINMRWIFPEWVCKLKETTLFLNYYASVILLMVMSVDRYLAICYPFSPKTRMLRSLKSAVIVSTAVWCISLLFCTPVMLYIHLSGIAPFCYCAYQFPSDEPPNNLTPLLCSRLTGLDLETCADLIQPAPGSTKYCHVIKPALIQVFMNMTGPPPPVEPRSFAGCFYDDVPSGFKNFIICNFAIMYILPVIIMGICYGLIVRHVRASNQATVSKNSPAANKRGSRKQRGSVAPKRVTILCGSLVFSFIVLWLPFHGNHLAKMSGILENAPHKVCDSLHFAGSVMIFANSVVNPFLYNFLSQDFCSRGRAALNVIKKAFGCKVSAPPSAGRNRIASKEDASSRRTIHYVTSMSRLQKSRSEENVSKARRVLSQSEDTLVNPSFGEKITVEVAQTP